MGIYPDQNYILDVLYVWLRFLLNRNIYFKKAETI